ncbi:MAG: glycosyltransferase, partial [Firmicutes bacterium]|nr:glycosyltransferase [Bacillota bacterium]
MLRVVMVVNSDFRYDSRVQKEAIALCRAGYEVTVFSLALSGAREQNSMGVRLINPASGKMAWLPYKPSYLRVYCRVVGALLREHGDVWHGHDLETLPFVCLAAKLKGGRLVYDSHEIWQEYDWPGKNSTWRPARRLLWRGWLWLERVLARRCNLVITVNESCAREIARTLKVRMPLVLRNCVDPVVEEGGSGRGLRERLEIGTEPLAVYTGQFQTGRGLENLLRAWAMLPARVHLALVGRGPLEKELRRLAISAGLHNVHFLPPVEAW